MRVLIYYLVISVVYQKKLKNNNNENKVNNNHLIWFILSKFKCKTMGIIIVYPKNNKGNIFSMDLEIILHRIYPLR